jgi:superoxide dismutase, Fe-Mn family
MHEVASLPYKYSALEPYIDEETMRLHHLGHHQAYVNKLNLALEKYPNFENKSTTELIADLSRVPEDVRQTVRDNGGGHLNHSLFWEILRPGREKNDPDGLIAADFEEQYGSYEIFWDKFRSKAVGHFGSGWVWLVVKPDKKLDIVATPNQDSPIMHGLQPILGVDLWEHAYYLRYQNRRPEYIDAFGHLINWDKVNEYYKLLVE